MIFIARISKYEEWKNDNELQDKLILIKSWARDGLTQQQIANNLGINVDTLIEYKKKYSDFAEALKKGKEVVDIEVENALLKSAKGFWYEEEVVSTKKEVIYDNGKRVKETSEPVVITLNKYKPSDTTAAIFWLKNRKPKEWRDRIEMPTDTKELTKVEELLTKLENEANK